MLKKKVYMDQIIALSEFLIKASDMLCRIYDEFQHENMKYLVLEMHEIENEADSLVHQIKRGLTRDFLMPSSRVDIAHLAESLDSVVDTMEDVVQSLYKYNITELRPMAKELIDAISEGSSHIHQMIVAFGGKKKSSPLNPHAQKIYQLEKHGDFLYIRAVKKLFAEEDDVIVLTQWEEILSSFETCLDRLKDCSDNIMKMSFKY